MTFDWPWLVLAALGASHGVNPAMGWLFAVALGMQEGSVRAVWRALLPLAVGHAAAIVVVLATLAAIGEFVSLGALKWGVAGVLFAFACLRIVRRGHPRFGGMRVGARDLAIWSFLMASAHGAGLMVAPFALPVMTNQQMPHAGHIAASAAGVGVGGAEAALLHTAGYLAVTAALALVVYTRIGLASLRSSWINIDVIWTVLLTLTAVATPFL
jgi:hypothetical protein